MLLNIFVSVFALLNSSCDSIQIQLLDKEIQVKPGETIINCRLNINSCLKDYLLYNFNDHIEPAWIEEFNYCTKEITAGLAVFVYDEKMEPQYAVARIPDSINYKPISNDELQKRKRQIDLKFRDSKQVLIARKSLEFSKKIDLGNFRLSSGTYYMKLLYYEGDNIVNLITKDQMAEDTKKHKAEIFKGCISSNLVKLIVE